LLTACFDRNIVDFIGFVEEVVSPVETRCMLLLELAEHGSLNTVLSDKSISLPWTKRRRFAEGLAHGLHYLHESRQMIHRDIKSLNLLVVGPKMTVKLTDFDQARRFQPDSMYVLSEEELDSGSTWTATSASAQARMTAVVGTPEWTAVELLGSADGQVFYGKAIDVYSFGIVLSEIATRRLPYTDKERKAMSLRSEILDGLRPAVGVDVPEDWCKLMKQCWDEDPASRPTIVKVVAAVAELCAELVPEETRLGLLVLP
jgi:serine/threonine protein kinase